MLIYLNAGMRQYAKQPVSIYRRERWEFQAVVAGQCAPLLPDEPPQFCRRHLWVFAPRHAHGWVTPDDARCRIVVAHFGRVPEPLRETLGSDGMLAVPLSAHEAKHVETLIKRLAPDFHRPTQLSSLRSESALLALTTLALRDEPERPLSDQQGHARRKVAQALAWYGEHLADRPSVEQVAAAVFVSPSHLRRLFVFAGEGSPLAAMHRVQAERARQLMRNLTLSLTDIADACGYSSLSVFSRSFRAAEGVSPRAWRARFASHPHTPQQKRPA